MLSVISTMPSAFASPRMKSPNPAGFHTRAAVRTANPKNATLTGWMTVLWVILVRTPLELLVGQARIDGEISDEERSVLVRIASSLGITGDDFQTVYQAGIQRADKIRKSRQGSS